MFSKYSFCFVSQHFGQFELLNQPLNFLIKTLDLFDIYIFAIFTLQSRLVLERTVRCSRSVRFFVMFDMFEVRFWAKM